MKGNNACQKEQHSEWEIAVFCIVALGVLLTFNILIFRNSRDSLLKLQEDNMLATAKTVANSLQNFYDREMEELTLYFNEELEEAEIRSYGESQDTISYVALLDKDGKLKYSYGKNYDSYVKKELEGMGYTPEITQYNFCTNGSHYAGEAGIKTFGLGPSKENLAHTVNEYIEIDQLTKVTDCYYGVMKALLK